MMKVGNQNYQKSVFTLINYCCFIYETLFADKLQSQVRLIFIQIVSVLQGYSFVGNMHHYFYFLWFISFFKKHFLSESQTICQHQKKENSYTHTKFYSYIQSIKFLYAFLGRLSILFKIVMFTTIWDVFFTGICPGSDEFG